MSRRGPWAGPLLPRLARPPLPGAPRSPALLTEGLSGAIPGPPGAAVAGARPRGDGLGRLAATAHPPVPALASPLPSPPPPPPLPPPPPPPPADRAQDRAAALRAQIAARLREGDVDPELAMLAPLFEEHAPAMVAAALLAMSRQSSVVSEPVVAGAEPAGWSRLFVSVGRKDRASAKDLVGALI